MIICLSVHDEGNSVTFTKEKAKENLSRLTDKFEKEIGGFSKRAVFYEKQPT